MNAIEDRELERFLQGGDAVSRAYAELKSERPSPALDQAVIAQARDALRALPDKSRARYRGWPAMTAIAATVLLSFTLVMRVLLESGTPHQTSAAPSAVATPAASRAAAPAALEDHAAASSEPAAAFATPPASAPAPSSIEKSRPVIEAEIRAAAELSPTVDEPSVQSSVSGSRERRPAAAERQEIDDAQNAVAAPSRQGTRQRVDESASASSKPYAVVSAESLAKKEQLKPAQEWLEEIEQLRVSGELEAADRELERFKQAYPGYLESQASPADR